jgi:hypothetical protein
VTPSAIRQQTGDRGYATTVPQPGAVPAAIGTAPHVSEPPPLAPTAEPSGTPQSEAIEVVLLHRIAELVCPYPDRPEEDYYDRDFITGGPDYCFMCVQATGHRVTVVIQRYADAAAARAQFEAEGPPGPVDELHGRLTASWEEDHPSFPGGRPEYRVWLMQVSAWLVHISSFDDTHFIIAPDPGKVADQVLQAMMELGVLQPPEASP